MGTDAISPRGASVSVRQMALVFELDNPPLEKLLLLAMADHAGDNESGCYPSVGRLARKTSLTERGVWKILHRLKEQGLVNPRSNSKGGRGRTVRYQLCLQKGERCSGFRKKTLNTVQSKTLNREAQNPERGSGEPSRTIRGEPQVPQNGSGKGHSAAASLRRRTSAAFSAIGFDACFGTLRFQAIWTANFEKAAEWLTIKMEACIQQCQREGVGVPPQFYSAKHTVESDENLAFKAKYRRTPL